MHLGKAKIKPFPAELQALTTSRCKILVRRFLKSWPEGRLEKRVGVGGGHVPGF